MTPEDVKAERIKMFQIDTHIKENGPWPFSDFYADFNTLAPCADRVMKWEFNSFHDGANYTVGDYRFWFQLKEGHVKAGYAHIHRGGGFGGTLQTKHCYGKDPFKGITTLQQIDTLFGMMSTEYR